MKIEDQQHIDAICRRNGIHWITPEEMANNVVHNQNHRAASNDISCNAVRVNDDGTRSFGIYISPTESPSDECRYFAALHEIGHCMLKHAYTSDDGAPPNAETVQHEVEAWEWTIAHAQYFPSDEAIVWILSCL